jgi:hypothetical protein
MNQPMSAALPAAAAPAPRRGLPPWLRKVGVALRSFALFLLA